jgi:hypothetical protein
MVSWSIVPSMATVRIGMLVIAAMSTWLVIAVPARADNATDFLAKVSEEGLNTGDTSTDVQLTLYLGTAVCELMHYGYTPQIAGRQVLYRFPNATPGQVAGFVDAAQAKLCAQDYGPLDAGY